jgi:hypothetical protein
VIVLRYANFLSGIPLANIADCDEESPPGASTITLTIVTTVTMTVSASASSLPSDSSKADLCQGPFKRHSSLVLWNGTTKRTDTSGNVFENWPWMEEVEME